MLTLNRISKIGCGGIAIKREFIRQKVVHPASLLKPAEKIKLYNKENKELFGRLLETNKQKNSRLKKEGQ